MTAEAPRSLPPLPPLSSLERVHIIGVCGTAMGTLAAMMSERGHVVSGSDAMGYPPMSDWVRARGIDFSVGYDAANIPADTDLVVVGNVARVTNPEAVEAKRRGLPMISLPEALRLFFFEDRHGLVVTGTHGKTTTTSMLAFLLHAAGRDPSFLVGGITRDFDSNYRLGDGPEFVVEGDEYDTAYFDKVPKFWHYPAVAATINNVEFDHVDIYPDLNAIRHVFRRFAEQVDPGGVLWVNGDDAVALECAAAARAPVRRFGLGEGNDLRAIDVRSDGAGTHATVVHDGAEVGEAHVPLSGDYNVRNFLGAAALASSVGVPLAESCRLIAGFRGVRKRLELKGVVDGIPVIDDFAHHPTAVREALRAIRARYPERRVWAVFEAKSNTSRRAVFQDRYPASFENADIVVLSRPWKKDDLPPEQLLSIEQLADDIRALGKEVLLIPDVAEIVRVVGERARPGDVIAGLSGSAFGGFHDAMVERLAERADSPG